MTKKQLSYFSILLLLFVLLFGFLTHLFKGVPLAGDLYFLYHPQNHLITEMFQKGNLPLWNPYLHCGAPLIANLREGIFYPLSVIFRFFDFVAGNNFFLLLHYFLAGFFACLFASFFRLNRIASLLLSLSFAFNGFFFLHSAYYNQFAGMIWLPLCAIFFTKHKSYYPAIFSGIAASFSFLSGNPFFFYETVIIIFLFGLYGFLSAKEFGKNNFIMLLSRWGLATIVFMTLSSVQLIPFRELTHLSTRKEGLPFSDSMVFSELPSQLARFLITPLWNWRPVKIDGDPTIVGFYMGITILLLSIKGIWSSKNRTKWFWSSALIVSLILSLGIYLPGYVYIWSVIPGIKYLRFPAQWLFISAFSFSVLASFGMETVKKLFIKQLLLILVIAELFLFASKNPFGIAKPEFLRLTNSSIANLQKTNQKISHIREGFGLGEKELKTESDWIYSRSVLLPNLSVPYHILSASGYGITEPIWKHKLFSLLSVTQDKFKFWNMISGSQNWMVYREEKERMISSCVRMNALPYAGLFKSARFFNNETEVIRKIEKISYDPENEILILTDQEENKIEEVQQKVVPVNLSFFSENKLKIDLPSIQEKNWLYLAENYYPGWKAFVHGKERKIFRANFSFKAVFLPETVTQVVLIYRPESFLTGLSVTVISILFLTIFFIVKFSGTIFIA